MNNRYANKHDGELPKQQEFVKGFLGQGCFVIRIFQCIPIVLVIARIAHSKPCGPSLLFEQYGYASNSYYGCGIPRVNSTGLEWQF